MAEKDFGPIESDYAFFVANSTEAESDGAEYARALAGFADARASIRMLDFGCGTGAFTEHLLTAMHWPPRAVELTLVEPVRHQRETAAVRLAKFSEHAIAISDGLPPDDEPQFDFVLSNHALYYVDDLDKTLRRITRSLLPRGKLLLAIAGWDNALVQLWKTGFAMLGKKVPYYTAEDVEAALSQLGARFRKTKSSYQLRFRDSSENRLRILRFLFGNYLDQITHERLLGELDRHVQAAHVDVNTCCYHFAVEPA